MNPLRQNLGRFRRRLRFVVSLRSACWLTALVLVGTALVGWLDWQLHLPDLVRALLLAAGLTGILLFISRFWLRPLAGSGDDLHLALNLEERFPVFKDSLASAVEFLAQPLTAAGSPDLKLRVISRVCQQTQGLDFRRLVGIQGLRRAGLALAVTASLAVAVVLSWPRPAFTALHRLTNPFGGQAWTALEMQPVLRVGRREPYEIHGRLHGVIPAEAAVAIDMDGQVRVDTISPVAAADGTASLHLRLEPDRVRRDFRFQVRANDAASPWYDVAVVPPPALVPLDGRPSPQVRLEYPAYTRLRAADLPDGLGPVEAVAGTRVTFRARVDRPLPPGGAWIEIRSDNPAAGLAAGLAPLGASDGRQSTVLTAACLLAPGRVPVQLDAGGTMLTAHFLPCASGTLVLHLVDDTGVGTTYAAALRVLADPPPTVHLVRPAATQDNLLLLPGADVALEVVTEDPAFAVRNVHLEYRCRKADPPRRLLLSDHRFREAAAALSPRLAAPVLPIAGPADRSSHLLLSQRLALSGLRHLDGSSLQEGDVVTIRAVADDFDDVALFKSPGGSHEVELRIISPAALETLVNQGQAQIQQELLRLREQQRESQKKTEMALKEWRGQEQLRPEMLDSLVHAEQLQQQVSARVGHEATEGLRAEVRKLRQTLEDNHLPRSGASERLETLADQLGRLARQELEQVEALLTAARKETELSTGARSLTAAGPLDEAVRQQGKVHRTLTDLLALLEPWSQVREVKGEARSLLEDQRRLGDSTQDLGRSVPAGAAPAQLPRAQQAELKFTEEWQARQADQWKQLLSKMDRLAADKERQAADRQAQADEADQQAGQKEAAAGLPATAADDARRLEREAADGRRQARTLRSEAATLREESETLGQAAQQGRAGQLDQRLAQAATDIARNQLGQAGQAQKAAAAAMNDVVQTLESRDRRADELDRLLPRIRQAEAELARLAEEQERLRQKTRDAQRLADPAQRRQELQRLAREQEQLNQKAQDLLQRLTRMGSRGGAADVGQAGQRMDDALQRLERGEDAAADQQEVLDRLDEARRELQRTREEVEEELAREKLTRVADLIRRLRERQHALQEQTAGLHKRLLESQAWSRPLQASLIGLAQAQKGLSQETADLGKNQLAGTLVFARLVQKAAEAMDRAEQQMRERLDRARSRAAGTLDGATEDGADAEVRGHQQAALDLFDRLLDAVKPEEGQRLRQAEAGETGGGASAPPGDGIPVLAQLKALKALQEEINRRTRALARRHPDPASLADAARAELDGLRRDQLEVTELFDRLTTPATEGGSR